MTTKILIKCKPKAAMHDHLLTTLGHEVGHVVEACRPLQESPEEAAEQLRKAWLVTVGDAGLQELEQVLTAYQPLKIAAEGIREQLLLSAELGLPVPVIRAESSKPSQSLPSISTLTVIDRAINQRKTGLSPSSLSTYKTDWRNFAQSFPILPEDPQPVRDYIYGYSNLRSRAKIHSELNTLYQCAQGLGIKNVMLDVERPPRVKKLAAHHSVDESRAIVTATKTPLQRALVNLIERLGLRIGEVASMNVSDVSAQNITFRGKTFGGKAEDREIWPPQDIMASLKALCDGRAPGKPLFVGQRGQLTTTGLRRIYEMLCQQAGIPEGRRHPHCGRHSAGTHLIEAGCDQFTVKRLLGHKRMDQTDEYVHLALAQGDKLERYDVLATGKKTPDYLPSEATKLYIEGLPEAALLPRLLDQLIALGDIARELNHALGGNGHQAEQLKEIKEFLEHRACK